MSFYYDNHNNRQEMNNRGSRDKHQGAALQSLGQGDTVSQSLTLKISTAFPITT